MFSAYWLKNGINAFVIELNNLGKEIALELNKIIFHPLHIPCVYVTILVTRACLSVTTMHGPFNKQ